MHHYTAAGCKIQFIKYISGMQALFIFIFRYAKGRLFANFPRIIVGWKTIILKKKMVYTG